MGDEAPSRSVLLGSHLPPDGKGKFLTLEDAGRKDSRGDRSSLTFAFGVNSFCKGSEGKRFRLLAHLVSVTTTQLRGCSLHAVTRHPRNAWARLPPNSRPLERQAGGPDGARG